MNKLNLRQFGRDLTLTGGTYEFSKAFNVPSLILDGQNVDTVLEEFDTAIDLNTGAIDDAVAAIGNNTAAIGSNTTAISALPLSERLIYVDASAGAGTGVGTFADPYRNLKTALETEVTQAETDDMVFHVGPGIYVGVYTFTKDVDKIHNQSISIVGSGSENTILRGSAAWDSTTPNMFFARRFKSVFISNVSIENCKYGAYIRDCQDVVLHNVHFTRCGSDGDLAMYDFSNTQQQFYDWFASTKTSNGGAMRLRSNDHVEVQNCRAELCLRGMRIQDIGSSERTSMISNNMTYNTLESGIYMAANSYSQLAADGCTNVVVTGNHVYKAFNNGILCIGGRGNAIVNNVVQSCANAGIQLFHCVNTRVCNNSLDSCELLAYNGIGNNGDIGGQIVVAGNGNSTTDTGYIATISGNTLIQASGQSDRGVYVPADVYPTNINKIFSSGNVTDAGTDQLVDNAITINTSDPVAVDVSSFLRKDTSQTFSGGALTMESNGNQSFKLRHSGYGVDLLLASNYGEGKIQYQGAKIQFFGSRCEIQAELGVRVPRFSAAPSGTNNASHGSIYYNTTDNKLYFHNNSSWRALSFV